MGANKATELKVIRSPPPHSSVLPHCPRVKDESPRRAGRHSLRDVDEDVVAAVRRRDEAVAFGAREAFAHPGEDGTLRGSGRPAGWMENTGQSRRGELCSPAGGAQRSQMETCF